MTIRRISDDFLLDVDAMAWFAVRSCSRTRVGLSCSISVQLSLTWATNHYQGQTYSGVFCENSGHCLLWDLIFFFFFCWIHYFPMILFWYKSDLFFFYYCRRDVYVSERHINTIKGTFRNVRCFSTCKLINVTKFTGKCCFLKLTFIFKSSVNI